LHGQISEPEEPKGSIKGIVRESNNPIEFANVYLTLKRDTSGIVTGTITDSLGKFQLEQLPNDDYILNIRMIGFNRKQIAVSVNEANPSIDLQEITLEADATLLNAIEVTAARNIITKTEEGLVLNAAQNITQIGGTATDLLKNTPGVLVGADGEITLRGKSPLTLINGRTSGVAGLDRAAQLDRIPASSIERIEIINNPSAKYDADAEGGVINIVLKKNESMGLNGAFAVGAGLGDRYRLNASALMNYKTKKWNYGLAYDNWYTTRTRRVRGDRVNYDLPDEYYLTQRRFDERLVLYQNAKVNIDYAPSAKSNLSFEALWAFPGEDNNETLKNVNETSNRDFTNSNQRHSNEIRRSHAIEAALRYTKRFDNPDKMLSIIMSNTFGKDRENTDIDTEYLNEQGGSLGDIFWQRTRTYQNTNLGNASIDYANPIGEKGLLETGYKGIFRYLNSDFERATEVNGEYIIDPLNTNIFNFREQIHAAYSQYTGWTRDKNAPRWKYNFGLRAEQVWNNGKTKNETEDFENDYFKLYPSANLFYYTQKGNNVKLSYSRRINRPGLGALNPFTDITDSLNQRSGNPRLKPELVHSMEAGYNHSIGKTSISFSAFYRLRTNSIFPYTVRDENGVAFTKPLNFGNASTYGVESIVTSNPFSYWNINFSFSAYRVAIENSGTVANLSTDLTSWYTKLINNFTLAKGSRLQLVGNYTSPTAIPQGKSVAVYFVDLGFQQKIIKGNGRLGLTITDIFNTQKNGFITSDYNFYFSRVFKIDTRAVMLTFGYTFGTTFKEKLMENRFKND
jgi:outer membrane receptor protein involved in Fe transport